MCLIQPLDRRNWGVFDDQGNPVFFLEKQGAVEWGVRAYEPTQRLGRGHTMVIFIGSDAFDKACRWAEHLSTGRRRPVTA